MELVNNNMTSVSSIDQSILKQNGLVSSDELLHSGDIIK